jgi:hypothetical protein
MTLGYNNFVANNSVVNRYTTLLMAGMIVDCMSKNKEEI